MQRDDGVALSDCTTRPVTGIEAILLRELLTWPFCTVDRLMDQAWGHHIDGGPLAIRKNLHVRIRMLRTKLVPTFRIDCRWGQGYSLTELVK